MFWFTVWAVFCLGCCAVSLGLMTWLLITEFRQDRKDRQRKETDDGLYA